MKSQDSWGMSYHRDSQHFRYQGQYYKVTRSDHRKSQYNKSGCEIYVDQKYSMQRGILKELFELMDVYYETGICDTMTVDKYLASVEDGK
jgi:hypothetical protein